MAVTQNDVAREAGVSQSLVAHVLNGRPGPWASAEVRERIFATAARLQYKPNAAARALRSGKTNTVALLYARESSGAVSVGYSEVAEALSDHLAPLGYGLLIHSLPDSSRMMERIQNLRATGACDFFVLLGDEIEIEPHASLLAERGHRFALKGHFESTHPDWPQVDFDHRGMMRGAVAFLVGCGHRRIAYLGHENMRVYARELRAGFREAMAELAPAADLDRFHIPIRVRGEDAETVEEHMAAWDALPQGERPTAAVVGARDEAWLGLELALHRRGGRIGEGPGEFTVAGLSTRHHRPLFGRGYIFPRVELYDLGKAMAEQIVGPLLQGHEIEQPIVRVLPRLQLGPLPLLAN